MASSSLVSPKMRYDDFEWGETLGSGSYGEVVVAVVKPEARSRFPRVEEQISDMDYKVAVKRLSIAFINKEQKIKERTGRDVVKQVFTEKELLVKINSEFVIQLFGSFKTTDELFYVISYQNKGDLRDLLNDYAAIQFKNVQFLSAEIFSALFYLHDNNIIHRDMKPENILLHEYPNGVHIKLCDFATAKDLSTLEDGKRPTTFVGSAEYISPELLGCNKDTGKFACFESDIWATGCIVYYMLAGLPPFRANSEYLIFDKIIKNNFEFPEGFHPRGQSFISEILKTDISERLGADRKHLQIKSDEFYSKLNWNGLFNQQAPIIERYVPDKGADPENLSLGKLSLTEVPSVMHKTVDDPKGQGIEFILPAKDYEVLVRDQKMNKSNPANKWSEFTDNELIVKMGYMDKKRGLFSRKRMFLLTGGKRDVMPRLVYVDPTEWVKKGEIRFSAKFTYRQRSFCRFFITDPDKGRDGRIYDLTDKNSNTDVDSGAVQWLKKLKILHKTYFS